jgi:hypothetical protein
VVAHGIEDRTDSALISRQAFSDTNGAFVYVVPQSGSWATTLLVRYHDGTSASIEVADPNAS